MKLTDYPWINKGCTVEILYGEHRSFNGIVKEFKVVCMDLTKEKTVHGLNHFIVDVYGEHISFCQDWLKLLKLPGRTRIRDGVWIADYLLNNG